MKIKDLVRGIVSDEIDSLIKSADDIKEVKENINGDEKIGHKSIIEDPFYDNVSNQGVLYKQKTTRISNQTLKAVSIRDWLVSSIIQARVDTLLRFSRPEKDKFNMGYRISMKDHRSDITDEDHKEMRAIEDFIYHCGRIEGTPVEDRMLFGEFLKKETRDAITFGYIAIEKVMTRGQALHRFRPVPSESVYRVNKNATKEQLQTAAKINRFRIEPKSDNDPRINQVINESELDKIKYIQVTFDQQPLAVFGDEDMIFKNYNPQNFMDSNGYSYSPLELSIINVINHLNVEQYNSNFFTHGYAAKGILHLKGSVTQSQLAAFKRHFHAAITGTNHAWRTPVIAGLDEVQWISMSGNSREMEYINFNNHVMRTICTQFQIDPVELGLDYLANSGNRSSGQSVQNNQYKIEYSRERGLYPILMFFEDLINCEIIPAIDSRYAEKYKFEFIGYSDETPQTQVAQLQAEMTVHASMNHLLKTSQKNILLDSDGKPLKIAELPLNATFWGIVEKNMTKGEIREILFGDSGATKRKELQYFPGDPMFSQWQQMLYTMEQTKEQQKAQQQQMEMQAEQQKQEAAKADAEHQREQEMHDAGMEQQKNNAAHAAVSAGNVAKNVGFGSKPMHGPDGKPMSNPINQLK